MTENEKRLSNRAYGRGYNRGLRRGWPEHKPPLPPDPIIADAMAAASGLRDAVDAMLATFDQDDELNASIGPKIDALDAAMTRLATWLMETP